MAIFLVVVTVGAMVALDLFAPIKYYGTIRAYCKEYSVEPSLVLSVIWTESKFDKDAVSKAGAMGLMQLMPGTAEFTAKMIDVPYEKERLFEPEYNIRLGIRYLAYLSERFDGDLVLAAYNAGEGRASGWKKGEIPIRETAEYVKKVKFMHWLYALRTGS